MKLNMSFLLLTLVCVIAFLIKVYLVFSITTYDYDGYFTLRQVDSLVNDKSFLINDPLSFQGRTLFVNPLPYLVYALVGFAFSSFLSLKLLPVLLSTVIAFYIFLITKKITKNSIISLFTSIIGLFSPVLFFLDFNLPTNLSIFVIIFLQMIYSFFNLPSKFHHTLIILMAIFSVFTSPLSIIVFIGFFIYLFLMKLESQITLNKEIDITIFLGLLVFWVNLLIYKQALLLHGIGVIWKNVPLEILAQSYLRFDLVTTLLFIGPIPLFLGIYGVYSSFFNVKNKHVLLLSSFALLFFVLGWFALLAKREILVLMSLVLVLLSGFSISIIIEYFSKTKFHYVKSPIFYVLLLLFAFTTIGIFVTSFNSVSVGPTDKDVLAANYLREHTPYDSTILASPEEGFFIESIANRKVVLDTNFVLISDSENRYHDMKQLMGSDRFQSTALRRLNHYDVDYLFITDYSKMKFNFTKLYYVEEPCFELIYNDSVEVYEVKCDFE